METILWTQNEDPDMKETFIIDGIISTYEGTALQDKAFAFLLTVRKQRNEFFAKKIKILKERNPELRLSEDLQCYRSSQGTLIQASYNEKDESGRRMPYMFFSKSLDWKTIGRQLRKDSTSIKRTCHARDLEVLEELSESLSKKKRAFILLSMLCSTILLIILVFVIALWSR